MLVSTNYQVSLGTALSSTELQVAYVTGPGKTVLAFQQAPVPLTNIRESLNATGGYSFSIDRAYHGVVFAIINEDRSSTIFTVNTATPTQTLTFNDYDTVTQEFRRLYSLGYI